MGYCDVVEEFGAAEDEFLAPCCCLSEDPQRVVDEDAEDKLVETLGPR